MYTAEQMKKHLSTHVCRIEFEKRDGSIRILIGHRMVHLLSDEHKPKGERKVSGPSIPVFDTEKEEWRSFDPDNVISFTIFDITK